MTARIHLVFAVLALTAAVGRGQGLERERRTDDLDVAALGAPVGRGQGLERERRTDDLDVAALQDQVRQQAGVVERLAARLEATNAEVTATRAELKASQVQLATARATCEAAQTATDQRLAALAATVHAGFVKQAINVSFTVRFSQDPVNPGPRGTLRWDTAATPMTGADVNATSGGYDVNSGGSGYDVSTGIFLAPAPGTYVFFLTIMAPSTHWVQVALMHDGKAVDVAHAGAASQVTLDDQGSLMAAVRLAKGAKVWVQNYNGDSPVLRGGVWSSFTGFLLHAE